MWNATVMNLSVTPLPLPNSEPGIVDPAAAGPEPEPPAPAGPAALLAPPPPAPRPVASVDPPAVPAPEPAVPAAAPVPPVPKADRSPLGPVPSARPEPAFTPVAWRSAPSITLGTPEQPAVIAEAARTASALRACFRTMLVTQQPPDPPAATPLRKDYAQSGGPRPSRGCVARIAPRELARRVGLWGLGAFEPNKGDSSGTT